MRSKIYALIREDDTNNLYSDIYDIVMIVAIIMSLIPLAFKDSYPMFNLIEKVCIFIFLTDYFLRFITSDFKLKKGILSFFVYPITPMAIIDMLSILPTITNINNSFRLLRSLRLFRSLRVLRLLKFFRYSKSLPLIIKVFKREQEILSVVGGISFGYIIMSALIIFNVEPESFDTFFEAVYWATVSLTTVGYGDIYPVTYTGRLVAMVSSLFGIAIIALPAGIITAGFINELNTTKID